MSGPVRWGVLSTARINELLLAGARGCEAVEVLAVASREQAHAAAYAREHGIERAYGSYDALLADPQIEAVYISLPNALHVEWTIRALEAGKHVLCEKPLSRRAADAQRAFDVAERCGRLLMEAFMYRHNPQTSRLVELIGEGAVGRVRMIRASFGYYLDDAADVRLRRELEGGALMDVGCYCVNAARLLCGEPERVHAEQLLGGDGVDVAFAGVLGFADEVLAHFDCGFAFTAPDELVVLGERGSLHLADPWHCLTPGIELRRAAGSESIEIETVNSYSLELTNLSAAIRGTGAPLLGREDAFGQARAIEALYSAAAQRRARTP
jgi:D-xylose 1-dehydrogenase (NADP+, D-xylono-1,5-lactone-forming)